METLRDANSNSKLLPGKKVDAQEAINFLSNKGKTLNNVFDPNKLTSEHSVIEAPNSARVSALPDVQIMNLENYLITDSMIDSSIN